jgi:hypothetical protein
MPRTADEGFRDFLSWLTPTAVETVAAASHRSSIESCLKNNFGLLRFFRTGSFGNGTSISGYSDVDYFASLPNSALTQSSDYTLTKVRRALDFRFPNTDVRVNCPAVVVPFGTSAYESTELVPAEYIKEQSGVRIYDIPDCNNGWMRSSPDAHNEYVRSVDQKLNKKLKPLIRFVKAWKYFMQVPISSFYLELRVTKYAESESAIVYSIDLYRILKMLWEKDCADLQDPMGISGYIQASKTDAQRNDAVSKACTAYVRAEKARDAERKDNIKDAFEWWGLLYGGRFPTYYY